MRSIRQLLARLWADDRGISSVEYALLLAMIAGGVILSVELLASAVSNELIGAAALFDDRCASDPAWAKTSPQCQ